MKLIRIILFFILLTIVSYSQQVEQISIGEQHTIFSKILDEERSILISVPLDYNESQKRYPVIYITDGGKYRLLGYGGLVHYLGYYEMPEMITVFIPNTDRGRDLSVDPLEQLPNSGGADNFLNFITDELIPYIDDSFRKTGYRVLFGSSAGGEFTFYTLITKPDFFDAYIAGSICLFEEKKMLERTRDFFKTKKKLDKFLFVPYYEKDFTISTLSIPKIKKIVNEFSPEGFRFFTRSYPGQAHVPNMSFFDGLLKLFEDYEHIKIPEIIPSNGNLLGGESIDVEIEGYDEDIRYTLDGSEPTRESLLYAGPIKITEPTIIKAKTFRGDLCESSAVTAEFKQEDQLSPVKVENLRSGLEFKYFDRRWFRLTDEIDLVPTIEGVTHSFNIENREKDQGFIYQLDGLLHITNEGYYRFFLLSTSGSKLFLGDNLIITNRGSKSFGDLLYEKEEYSYQLFLKPGYYPIKALYANAWFQGSEFKVYYQGPGINKQEIALSVLFY